MEITAKLNLQKLQCASSAQQVMDLYQSLKTDGHLQPVHLSDVRKHLEMDKFELHYNGM